MTDRAIPSAIEERFTVDDAVRLREHWYDGGRLSEWQIGRLLDIACKVQASPSSERASADEGYPGIAHDLETMRTTLERARRHIALNGAFRSNDDMMREIDLVLSAPRPSIAPLADLDFERADKLALDALTYESGSLTGEERKALARAYRALRSLPPTTAPSTAIRSIKPPDHYDDKFVIEYVDGNTAEYRTFPELVAFLAERDQALMGMFLRDNPSTAGEPVAWRYRYRGDSGEEGEWKYVDREGECNPLPSYEREPLFLTPSAIEDNTKT